MLERVHAEPSKIDVSDFSLLKSATRAAIRAAGPLTVVSRETRLDGGTLSRAGNIEQTNFIPIDDALRLDAMTGDATITRTMAALLGFRLVPVEPKDEGPSLIHDAATMARESGELVSETLDVSSDGQITPTEARRGDEEAADVEHCVQSMRKKLHGVMAKHR